MPSVQFLPAAKGFIFNLTEDNQSLLQSIIPAPTVAGCVSELLAIGHWARNYRQCFHVIPNEQHGYTLIFDSTGIEEKSVHPEKPVVQVGIAPRDLDLILEILATRVNEHLVVSGLTLGQLQAVEQ